LKILTSWLIFIFLFQFQCANLTANFKMWGVTEVRINFHTYHPIFFLKKIIRFQFLNLYTIKSCEDKIKKFPKTTFLFREEELQISFTF
jgi:hypothetical protein